MVPKEPVPSDAGGRRVAPYGLERMSGKEQKRPAVSDPRQNRMQPGRVAMEGAEASWRT